MKILSDTYKIEVTYDELLFIYDGMMKVIEEKNGQFQNNELELKHNQCFEISLILGKKDDFLHRMEQIRKNMVQQ